MPPAQRTYGSSLIRRMAAQPFRYGFFQTVRLLRRYFLTRGTTAIQANADPIRFTTSTRLCFAPSEVESAKFSAGGRVWPETASLGAGVCPDGPDRVEITPGFFGLLGNHGSLPYFYTEAIRQTPRGEDSEAPAAFLDIFTQRSGQQLFQAWAKYKPMLRYELEQDSPITQHLLCLAGQASFVPRHARQSASNAPAEEQFAYYAATFWRRTRSASAMEAVLSQHFSVPVFIEQFIPQWYEIPCAHRSRLNAAAARLGTSAVLGERVLQCDLQLRVRIGPLTADDFARFTPGAAGYLCLQELVLKLAGEAPLFQLVPILEHTSVTGITLGDRHGHGLGRDSFLQTRPSAIDRDDAVFRVHPSPLDNREAA
ncbi:MAG: type VI secretion system baseplate subunit TssG [Salinisphaeraceae bacterium]|nr:type VI secretion system baseplate subunit TssG [Salinisphaeraceae bacterium]